MCDVSSVCHPGEPPLDGVRSPLQFEGSIGLRLGARRITARQRQVPRAWRQPLSRHEHPCALLVRLRPADDLCAVTDRDLGPWGRMTGDDGVTLRTDPHDIEARAG